MMIIGTSSGDRLLGTRGADQIDGLGGDDVLNGRGGNDVLDGGAGSDVLSGDDGDDTLYSYDFADGTRDTLIDGGRGTDYAYVDRSSSNLALSFSLVKPDVGQLFDGTTMRGVEQVTFVGGSGDDAVTGGMLEDALDGMAGSDILDGGGGGDYLSGGQGADALSGGDGNDTLSSISDSDSDNDALLDGGAGVDIVEIDRSRSTAAISFSVADASVDQSFLGTTLRGVEQVTFTGGSGGDSVTGGALDDILHGRAGDDALNGGGGNDYLDGGQGADALSGGDGDDMFLSASTEDGSHDVLLDGGAGVDLAQIERTTSSVGISFSLSDTAVDQLFAGTTLRGIERINFIGGSGADIVTGGALRDQLLGQSGDDILGGGEGDDGLDGGMGNDTLSGGEGDDLLSGGADGDALEGGAGNDTLDGGQGADALFGGEGDDTLVSSDDSADATDTVLDGGVGTDLLEISRKTSTLAMSFSLADPAVDQHFNGTTIRGIERLTFTGGTGADLITGGALEDQLSGQPGDDILEGGGGSDNLSGDDGRDVLSGGDGADRLSGGIDADTLAGGGGDDNLDGGQGADALWGGDGDDTLVSFNDEDGVNDTLLDGGSGSDIAEISRSTSTASLSFSLADPALDQVFDGTTLRDIEGVVFRGGSGNDVVTGGRLDDQLSGQGGDDFLSGGGGDDILNGGQGGDVLSGGDGDDTLESLDAGDGTKDLLLDGGAGVDHARVSRLSSTSALSFMLEDSAADQLFDGTTIRGIERISMVGGSGDDSITGGALEDELSGSDGADSLNGGAGNDAIDGGRGADAISGGAGDDKLFSYDYGDGSTDTLMDGGSGVDKASIDRSSSVAALSVSLTDSPVDQTFDGTTLRGIEQVYFVAGSGDDSLAGGALEDQFFGQGGNDRLAGGGGDDALDGGAGIDTLVLNGTRGDYLFSLANGTLTVEDLRPGSPDGIDAVTNVERVEFVRGRVKPINAAESDLANNTLQGTASQDVFLFDSALGFSLGSDTVTNFGKGDRIVTTSAIYDQNNDRKIGANSSDRFSLPSTPGTDPSQTTDTLKIFSTAGKAVSNIKLVDTQVHEGVTFYVYAAFNDNTAFGDLLF